MAKNGFVQAIFAILVILSIPLLVIQVIQVCRLRELSKNDCLRTERGVGEGHDSLCLTEWL